MSINLDEPARFLPLGLHHHFGGRLLDQDQALLAWATSFLQRTPLSAEALVKRFADPECVPQPITIELQEARKILQRGTDAGVFVKRGKNEYELHSSEQRIISLAQEQANRDRRKAEDAFRLFVLDRFPHVHSQVIAEMWLGLQRFTLEVVLDYVSKTATLENRYAAMEIIDRMFTKGSAQYDIASTTYPEFLQSASEGKKLFANALSSAIYALRTTISDGAAENIKSTLKYRTIYLDTNVIFSVVGLRGEPEYEESTRRLLEMARSQGFSLRYTAATKLEYGEALERVCNRLMSADSLDQEPVYITKRRKGSIERAYFLQRSDRKPAEFLEYYRDLPARLKAYDKLSISEAYMPSPQAEALKESDLFRRATEALLAIDYDRVRREHDAYNLAVVLDERDESQVFSKTPSWLITHHAALARANRRLGARLPVVMTLDSWVLHFRRFLSRVENFDTFLVDMITNNVLSEFRLSDQEIEEASRFLSVGGNREAGEVISAVLQRTPATTIRKALEDGDDTDTVVQRLLDHDKQLLDGLSEQAKKLAEAEISKKEDVIAQQGKALEERDERLEKLEQAITIRDEALKAYQEDRKARDTIEKSLDAHKEALANLREDSNKVHRRRFVWRVSCAPIAFIASTLVFWVLLGSPISLEGDIARILLLVGFTPVLIATVVWWFVGVIYRQRIAERLEEISAEEREIEELRRELNRRDEALDKAAGLVGLV